MGTNRRHRVQHGVFLYPSGEVYAGQWVECAAAAANAAPWFNSPPEGSGGSRITFNGTGRPSDADAFEESEDKAGVMISAEGPTPRREGWGVHLRGLEKYEGEWRHDAWHGLGSLAARTGDRYMGQFLEGVRAGRGVSISGSGVLHEETWEQGKLAQRRHLFRAGSGIVASVTSPVTPSSPSSSAPSSRAASPPPLPRKDESVEGGHEDSSTATPVVNVAPPEEEDPGRSSVIVMNSWSPREVACLARCLGLGASVAAKLRAHYVGGAALGTLASHAAATFLSDFFDDDEGSETSGPSAARRLFVITIELFLKFRNKLSAPQISAAEFRDRFLDLEIEEKQVGFDEVVGEGGYGLVYRARWKHTDVAAKAFRSRKNSGFVSRIFYSEFCMLQRLRHPNVTQLLGFCVTSPRPQWIIITELVRGGSLFDLLHTGRHLPDWDWDHSSTVDVATQICFGMVYLHANGIVHCDLKSGNVLLNGPREVKICDFGLAHLLSDTAMQGELSINIGCVGTLQWMAPEVLRGEEFSKVADVYSFGMILWEMISHEVPFKNYTAIQVIGIVGYGRRRPQPPQNCPEPWRDVLQKTLQPWPRSRRSFQELGEDLGKLHSSTVIDVEERLWTFFTGPQLH